MTGVSCFKVQFSDAPETLQQVHMILDDVVLQMQAANESCPPELNFSYAPQTPICRSAWEAAKTSKNPCDPMQDSDCDGRLNAVDNYLLKPTE